MKRSQYVQLLLSRYGDNVSEDDRDSLRALKEIPKENGMEGEMLAFLQEHPEASFQDVMAFFFNLMDWNEPLEIVDDDDLDEDD